MWMTSETREYDSDDSDDRPSRGCFSILLPTNRQHDFRSRHEQKGGGVKLEIEIMSHSSECHLNIVVCHVMSIMDPLRQEQSLN